MSVIRKIILNRRTIKRLSLTNKSLHYQNRNGYSTHSTQGIINSGLEDIDIAKVSLSDFIFENIDSKWENFIATECGVTGRKYTYKEIRSKSKKFSASLIKKFGLQPNDTIAIILPNIPEFPIVTLGALNAGLICTTVNPIYKPAEISRQLLDSSAKLIITLNELWPLATAALQHLKKNLPIITINSQQGQSTPEGAANFNQLVDSNIDLVNKSRSWNDFAFLPYSSGTTGLPKGVQLTHYNLVANALQLEHPEIQASMWATSDTQDVTIAVLPFFHIYGFTILCMHQLRIGGKTVTLPKFTPELYIDSLKKHKPHVLYVAPPIAIFLAKFPYITSNDFVNLRTFVNGAAPLGPLDELKLKEKVNKDGLSVLQGYGLTETSPTVASTRLSDYNKKGIGSIGKPVVNTTVKIIDPEDSSGTPLGPNKLGELLVQGPQVMNGYLNRPEENDKIFLDGWMRTGDMVYYDEEGYLFLKDRLKELIKVKGFQVAPAELEEIIRDFPDVIDAGVIGIPHETDGEVPKAYIVSRPNTKIDVNKVAEYVNNKVAPFKRLAGGVCLIDAIPKNASGKILRRELKLMHEKGI